MADLENLRTKTGQLLEEGARSGLLTPEELSWRRSHLERATTVDALEALVEDLLTPEPPSGGTVPAVPRVSQLTVMASRGYVVSDLGRRSELVTILGSTRIDLSGVDPAAGLTLELVTVMGDTVVEVPAGVRVRVEATAVMGDSRVDPALRDQDSAVRINGVVLMGSLRIVAKSTPGRPRR